MTLDELVARTRSDAASTDPLDLLAAAARQQQTLQDLGEELLDHWVQHARTAGCSWARIGTALGVSKQAVQQRHSPARSLLGRLRGALRSAAGHVFERFDVRAREAVVLAQEEARLLRHQHIGTEHLLLGLLRAGGIAAESLHAAGADLERMRAEVTAVVGGCGEREPHGHIPFTPRAKKVLELSLREALQLRHNHIGTEHVLLGLTRDTDGVAALALGRAGIRAEQLHADVLDRLGPADR